MERKLRGMSRRREVAGVAGGGEMMNANGKLRAARVRNKSPLCCTKKCPHYLQDEKNH